jgi:hypothetical protein
MLNIRHAAPAALRVARIFAELLLGQSLRNSPAPSGSPPMQPFARDERFFLGLCALIVLTQLGPALTSLVAAWRGPYSAQTVVDSELPITPGESALVSKAPR